MLTTQQDTCKPSSAHWRLLPASPPLRCRVSPDLSGAERRAASVSLDPARGGLPKTPVPPRGLILLSPPSASSSQDGLGYTCLLLSFSNRMESTHFESFTWVQTPFSVYLFGGLGDSRSPSELPSHLK